MSDVEEESGLKRCFVTLEALTFGLVVKTEGIETVSLVNMVNFVIILFSHKFFVDLNSFLVVAVVEIHVG